MASRHSGVSLEAAVRHYADHEAVKELERLENLGAFEPVMIYTLGAPRTNKERLCDEYSSLLAKLEERLVERMTNGELVGSGHFSSQPLERTDVDAELWPFLEVYSDKSKAKGEGFTISAIMVREDKATKSVVSSVKAGRDCRAWLQAEVERLESTPLKAAMLKKAKEILGDRLAVREFNRAWSDIAPLAWKKGGRRKQTDQ